MSYWMLARFEPQGPRAVAGDIGRIMLDTAHPGYEVFNRDTLQSLVFAPRDTGLYLYARDANEPQPTEPIMHRYGNLVTSETGTSGASGHSGHLWILLAAAVAAAAWIRLREDARARRA